MDGDLCRFCFEKGLPDDKLISPCFCKGSLQFVHTSCFLKSQNKEVFRCSICDSTWGRGVNTDITKKEDFFFDWELLFQDCLSLLNKYMLVLLSTIRATR